MSAQIHHKPAVDFASLPPEILSNVASRLDTSSALAFALVSRRCTAPAEYGIYRNLSLAVQATYPQHENGFVGNSAEAETWRKGRDPARKECAARLKKKVKDMIQRLDRKRGLMVEGMSIAPRPTAFIGTVAILDTVSPTLTSLEIDHPSDEWDSGGTREHHNTIDYYILPSTIVFPSLRSLRLGSSVLLQWGLLALLTQGMPSLRSLDISFTDRSGDVEDESRYPLMPVTNAIQQLRLWVSCPWQDNGEGYTDLICDFLGTCTKLEQIATNFDGDRRENNLVLKALETAMSLRDIYWTVGVDKFNLALGEDVSEGFQSLRRLSLWASDDIGIMDDPPGLGSDLGNLDVFILQLWKSPHVTSTFIPPTPLPAQHLVRLCASQMRRSLPSAIHFLRRAEINHDDLGLFAQLDEIEAAGEAGFARTILPTSQKRRNDPGLLHVRLQLDHVVTADLEEWQLAHTESSDASRIFYETADSGRRRTKVYGRTAEPIWVDFLEYDGYVVPLWVLEAMRAAEAALGTIWAGKTVRVQGDTWKILTNWMEKYRREATREELIYL